MAADRSQDSCRRGFALGDEGWTSFFNEGRWFEYKRDPRGNIVVRMQPGKKAGANQAHHLNKARRYIEEELQ